MNPPIADSGNTLTLTGSGNLSGNQNIPAGMQAWCCALERRGGSAFTGVTVAGVAASFVKSLTSGIYSFEIWQLVGPVTGASVAIAATAAGGPTFTGVSAVSWSNFGAFGSNDAEASPAQEIADADTSMHFFGFVVNPGGTAYVVSPLNKFAVQLAGTLQGSGGNQTQFYTGVCISDATIGNASFCTDKGAANCCGAILEVQGA